MIASGVSNLVISNVDGILRGILQRGVVLVEGVKNDGQLIWKLFWKLVIWEILQRSLLAATARTTTEEQRPLSEQEMRFRYLVFSNLITVMRWDDDDALQRRCLDEVLAKASSSSSSSFHAALKREIRRRSKRERGGDQSSSSSSESSFPSSSDAVVASPSSCDDDDGEINRGSRDVVKNGRRKDGVIVAADINFLRQLASFYKNDFMTWMDKPSCPACRVKNNNEREEQDDDNREGENNGGEMVIETRRKNETQEERDGKATLVEVFSCKECGTKVAFPRYNSPSKLLQTRTGRCGEFTNLFGFVCASLGYTVRTCTDSKDHVWNEVLAEVDRNGKNVDDDDEVARHLEWVMVDPSEGVADQPSMYQVGWKKGFDCVVAIGTDLHIADVTPRYKRKGEAKGNRRFSPLATLQSLFARRKQIEERRRRFIDGCNGMLRERYYSCREPDDGPSSSSSSPLSRADGRRRRPDQFDRYVRREQSLLDAWSKMTGWDDDRGGDNDGDDRENEKERKQQQQQQEKEKRLTDEGRLAPRGRMSGSGEWKKSRGESGDN